MNYVNMLWFTTIQIHIHTHTQTHSQSITNIYKLQLPHLTQKSYFWNPKPMAKPQQTYRTHVVMVKLETHINTYSKRYTLTAMSKPQTEKKKSQISKLKPINNQTRRKIRPRVSEQKKNRKRNRHRRWEVAATTIVVSPSSFAAISGGVGLLGFSI